MNNGLWARVSHRLLYYISILLGRFIRVRPERVLCWSFSGTQFSCNPAAVTRYLARYKSGEFELFWLLNKGVDASSLPEGVKVVRYGSWRHIVVINSAHFILSNSRVENIWALWHKKPGQKYVMTYHAGMGIKMVESDAGQQYPSYLRMAKEDSERCDLMLAGSRFWSSIMRRSFQYDGEILEAGTPRNDVFFYEQEWKPIREAVYERLNITQEYKLVLYAPTFRNDGNLSHYELDWRPLIEALQNKFGWPFCVLFRLHPNMLKRGMTAQALISHGIEARDATRHPDIQELLVASDVLITDYSSAMFDMALIRRPVFLYANDADTYNRGTYIALEDLPFTFAGTQEKLLENIAHFDDATYREALYSFEADRVGSFENGTACDAFYQWMKGCMGPSPAYSHN